MVTLAVSMTIIKDKKKLASRVGETKNPHQPEPMRVEVFCFEYDAMLTKPLAPDEKTKLR